MKIAVTSKQLNAEALDFYLVQGEKGSTVVLFSLPLEIDEFDLTELNYTIRGSISEYSTLAQQALNKSTEDGHLTLVWVISENFTALSGEMQLELVGTNANATQVISFLATSPIHIQKGALEGYEPPQDVLQSALNSIAQSVAECNQKAEDCQTAYEALNAIALNPTYVGEDGYFYNYDSETQEYVKSSVYARGNRGDDGISPTVEVTPITDGHRVTITDISGTQSFDVLNGADGSGAGDMKKSVYDTNADGVVDDSEKLGGQLPSYYAKANDIPVVPGVATTTSNGLMSSNDKTKLDSIGASGTFTLSSASWSVGSSVVTQTAAVSGITATQAYIFDIVPTNANEVKAYGYIGKIESVSGGFRATCYDTTKYPTVNLTIQYRRIA